MGQAEEQKARDFSPTQHADLDRTIYVSLNHVEQMHRVQFRRMTLHDISGVLEVEHVSFTLPWTRDAFFNEITNNMFAKYMVMTVGERIIGYAGMWTVLNEAHITNIAVHPEYRGKRLGERLFRELVLLARSQHMERMTLEVRVSNHIAQRLYTKFGFISLGVRRGYYSDNQEDALIMWSDLEPTTPLGNEETLLI